MASYFSEAQIASLYGEKDAANRAYADLRARYIMRIYKDIHAGEHALHGYSRRLCALIRSINLVFEWLPPELNAIPEQNAVVDATIVIQSFVLNTFGCLDNLAWIFVHEIGVVRPNGMALDPQGVSLGSKIVRDRFSMEFNAYVDSRDNWFREIKAFRDALAHSAVGLKQQCGGAANVGGFQSFSATGFAV